MVWDQWSGTRTEDKRDSHHDTTYWGTLESGGTLQSSVGGSRVLTPGWVLAEKTSQERWSHVGGGGSHWAEVPTDLRRRRGQRSADEA